MKHLLLVIALSLATLTSWGQSYDKLWKAVEAQQAKDLPKSALSELTKIRSKAMREHNDAQLLRCVLVERQLQTDIAPDSSRAVLSRMEAAYAKETKPEVRALWQSALGQVYAAQWGDTAAATRAHDLLLSSVQDMNLLGRTPASLYMPLFTKGADSRYYGDDLLSVLVRPVLSHSGQTRRHGGIISTAEADSLRLRLLQHYKGAGRREAALLTELAIVDAQPSTSKKLADKSDFQTLCRLKETYKDLPLNVETYIRLAGLNAYTDKAEGDSTLVALAREGLVRYGGEKRAAFLKNYLQTKELPTLELTSPSNIGYPGDLQKVKVNVKNVKSFTLTIYRTALTAADLLKYTEAKDAVAHATLVRTLEHTPSAHPAYVTFSDSVEFVCGEPGIYVLRLSSPGLDDSYEYFRTTRLRPLSLRGNLKENRVTPVDAKSGEPLMGGQVKAYEDTDGKGYKLIKTYAADAEGNIFLSQKQGYRTKYLLSIGTDAYFPSFDPSTGRYYAGKAFSQSVLTTYTDRGIYRPGQQVQFAVAAYNQVEDEVKAVADLTLSATLLDTNGKEVDTLTIKTDALGAAGGMFTLPGSVLPGDFHIRVKSTDKRGFTTDWKALRVEEYKRPTFTVDLLEPDSAYKLGDSLLVEGKAETYTGLPLSRAKVTYTLSSGRGFRDNTTSVSGETTTDENGRFYVPVKFTAQDDEDSAAPYARSGGIYCPWYVHHYDISADITSQNGETQTASRTLYASRQSSWLAYDWQETMCRENLKKVTVWRRNAPWHNIADTGRYEICKDSAVVLSGSFKTGEAFVPAGLSQLGSGQYQVRLYCADLKAEAFSFTLMSETDKHPWGKDEMTYYVRANESGDSVFVMVGTPHQNVTLFYDLVAKGEIIASKRYKISDSIEHFSLNYKEEYGDGARACFAFVYDGTLHTQSVSIQRPAPEKRLQMRWSTFRSKLQPGAKEEWRLSVTRPDGTAADASVMACLYDASLNDLAANNWNFALSFPRTLPHAYYLMPGGYLLSLSSYGKDNRKNVPEYAFTEWRSDLFDANNGIMLAGGIGGLPRKSARMATTDAVAYAESAEVMLKMNEVAVEDNAAEEAFSMETNDAASDIAKSSMEPRKNFAETAFFAPALRTDKKGETTLVFTLPESLTTWQFRALAHDADMNYGRMDTTVVARKDFMVQPNMPRFVREGDHLSIPVTITNLSEKAESGMAKCEFVDAETNRSLTTLTQPFSVEKEQTLHFDYEAISGHPVLIVRITAKGKAFADGEEHYLPVLTSREVITRTVPFSLTEGGSKTLRIDTLWQNTDETAEKRLVVEATSNPTWYAVAALPVVTDADCYSATEWARRYYALTLAGYIAGQNPEIRRAAEAPQKQTAWAELLKRNPELKQTLLAETPWADEAENESERVAALAKLFDETANSVLRTTALDNLQQYQLAEGAWGWFRGMNANTYITTEIAVMLARLYELTGDEDTEAMLRRAFRFLERETARQVKEMKKDEKKYKVTFSASEQQLKYLYVRSLLGEKEDADAKYLLGKFEKPEKRTMWEKAMTAVVLSRYGRDAAALTAVQSLKEHTVAREGMGRWFDTDRALWCGESYKIPTQTAAIEAFCRVTPDDTETINALKLWLMQARCTQRWETSRAVSDALYALLVRGKNDTSVQPLSSTSPLYYTLCKGEKVVAVNAQSRAEAPQTAGYFKQVYTDGKTLGADNIVVRKQGDGLAWGAVYAQYTLPAEAVTATGNGLLVSRKMEVKRGTTWVALTEGTTLTQGDRVRQVFTLTAERDYDFVSLKVGRAACLEPCEPLSGYTCEGTEWFYRVVRDASNEYFFEQMRKGTHTLTEEVFVDRSGTYTMGTAKVQSLYAPEFGGHTSDVRISVK